MDKDDCVIKGVPAPAVDDIMEVALQWGRREDTVVPLYYFKLVAYLPDIFFSISLASQACHWQLA